MIDGYNVILSDQKLSKLLRNDNEIGRREFLGEILRSNRHSREEITVVFDGRFAASAANESTRLLVRFTSRGETADDFIKREIGASPNRRSLIVVSNDLSIVSYARECGAGTQTSGEFLAAIREKRITAPDTGRDSGEKPEPTGRPDPELLRLFSGERKK